MLARLREAAIRLLAAVAVLLLEAVLLMVGVMVRLMEAVEAVLRTEAETADRRTAAEMVVPLTEEEVAAAIRAMEVTETTATATIPVTPTPAIRAEVGDVVD
jgi:hypothetical protein